MISNKCKKKTLFICTHYPLPENIGLNIRTMNFVHFFRHYGSVDMAYFQTLPGAQTRNSIFLNEYLLVNEVVGSYYDRLIRWSKIKSRPFPISQLNNASEKKLLSIMESNDYDYIFVRYIYNTSSLFNLMGKYKSRTIIDFDDILSGSLYESKIVSVNGFLRRLRLSLNQRYLMNYEKRCLNFGASLFCTIEDKLKVVEKNNRRNTFVVPNVYYNESFEHYSFGDGFENGNTLLFVGTLNYEPNIKGLKWFIESIFPNFKKNYSDAKLLVIGRTPPDDIKDICQSRKGIELYSDVPDINEYYKGCKAVIVPLFSGGGTRIKILEAALANRPVLSTPIGAEGLDFMDGTDLLVFNNSNDFCTQYKNLLDEKNYHSLIHNARNLVLSRYSIQNFNNVMEEVIKNL
jgi:polysaccharide biosynthesis protein PslH